MKTAPHAVALWVGTCCLAGCSGWQSALDPQGPQAKHLADLIWTFTIVCSLIWVVVILALLVGLSRRHQERPDPVARSRQRAPHDRRRRGRRGSHSADGNRAHHGELFFAA